MNLLASMLSCFCWRMPIIRLLFQHGKLWADLTTLQAARALMALAPGLVAFSLVNIFARIFTRSATRVIADENQHRVPGDQLDFVRDAHLAVAASRGWALPTR